MYEATNLPNIENEFNILIPCTNTPSLFPKSIVIAFAVKDKSVMGVTGLNRIVSAYRVYGPTFLAPFAFTTAVPTMTGLAANTDTTLDVNFDANWKEKAADTFAYAIEIPKIMPG